VDQDPSLPPPPTSDAHASGWERHHLSSVRALLSFLDVTELFLTSDGKTNMDQHNAHIDASSRYLLREREHCSGCIARSSFCSYSLESWLATKTVAKFLRWVTTPTTLHLCPSKIQVHFQGAIDKDNACCFNWWYVFVPLLLQFCAHFPSNGWSAVRVEKHAQFLLFAVQHSCCVFENPVFKCCFFVT